MRWLFWLGLGYFVLVGGIFFVITTYVFFLASGIYENAEAIRISADIDWNKNVKLVISVEESYEE